jgi:hypothetical protein
MSSTIKPKPPADYDDNPPWTDEDFARAVVIRDGKIITPEIEKLRDALRAIAESGDLETCHELAREALE